MRMLPKTQYLFYLDFGLAKSTNENGGLKTYCGTPQYFAPEVQ